MTTPSTAWTEQPTPGEAERFERYAEQLRDMQRKNARGGAPNRALHAKGLLGLEAEFTVLDDLPEHARIALFARPATYRAYVRFSNGAGLRQDDRKPDVRAIAIKLLGVEGKKSIPGMESATTHDFLMIRDRAQPFRNADEFVHFVRAASAPALLPGLFVKFGFGRVLQILKRVPAGLRAPISSLAETAFFTALPSRLGPYAIRCAVVPRAVPAESKKGAGADYLAEELAARLRQGPVEYDFQVQFFADERQTPIEDASVDWPDEVSPWLTVGRLRLVQQDPTSPRGQKLAAYLEKLSFDPWHALEQMRPLGNIMRARNPAYRLSTAERGAAPEPDGSERFD